MDNKKLAAYLKKTNKTESLFLHLEGGALYITDRFGLFRVEHRPKELAQYWPEKEGIYRIERGGGVLEDWTQPNLVKHWAMLFSTPKVHTLHPTRWGYAISKQWYREFVEGDHYTLISIALTDLFETDPDFLDLHHKYEQVEYQTAVRVLEHTTYYDLSKGQVDTYTPLAILMPLQKRKED